VIIKLVPRKMGNFWEITEIQDDEDFPAALVRTDMFWSKHEDYHGIYNKLWRGETVLVDLVDISEIEDE